MNVQHKFVIRKVMVKAMQYSQCHESINVEHQNNDGKNNVIVRNHTYVNPENYQSIKMSLDLCTFKEPQ